MLRRAPSPAAAAAQAAAADQRVGPAVLAPVSTRLAGRAENPTSRLQQSSQGRQSGKFRLNPQAIFSLQILPPCVDLHVFGAHQPGISAVLQ